MKDIKAARTSLRLCCSTLLVIVASAFWTTGLRADGVVLTSGEVMFGSVLRETESFVVLLVSSGLRAFPRASVARVRRGDDSGDEIAGAGEVETPSRSAGDRKTRRAAPAGSSAGRSGKTRRSSRAGEARKVRLIFTGAVPGASRARTRVGYFLRHRCNPPLELLPPGDDSPAEPHLVMTIRARVTAGRPVRFMGVNLGTQVGCHLDLSLFRQTGVGTENAVRQLLGKIGAAGSAPGKTGAGRGAAVSMAYKGAVDVLLRCLVRISLLGVRQVPITGPSN